MGHTNTSTISARRTFRRAGDACTMERFKRQKVGRETTQAFRSLQV
jgi:hypothetical protein